MRIRTALTLVAALAVLTGGAATLTGCSSEEGPTVVLRTATTGPGEVVVDAEGRAVYLYTADTRGADRSSCTGGCLAAWPAVTTDSDEPEAEGIQARVGEIPAQGGGHQLTLDGWPLYYFDGDTAPGMTKGQGIGGVWWLLAPDGSRVTALRR